MNWRTLHERTGLPDPRLAATWLGAAVVLGCGLWLSGRGGPTGLGLRTRPGAEAGQEMGWVDRRLETEEQAAGATADPRRECRIASLHWERAARLAQNEYYQRCGTTWTEDREPEYGPIRRQCLQQDASGDVAAARDAAERALALMPPGP